MAGWDRDVLRAFGPAACAWLAAVAAWLLLEYVQGQPLQVERAAGLQWTVVALLVTTLGHGGWVSWRLLRRRA